MYGNSVMLQHRGGARFGEAAALAQRSAFDYFDEHLQPAIDGKSIRLQQSIGLFAKNMNGCPIEFPLTNNFLCNRTDWMGGYLESPKQEEDKW